MKTKLALLVFAAASIVAVLTSCERPTDPAPIARTHDNFASPRTVGVLPDGRSVSVVVVDRGLSHDHFIYFVDNPDGKSTDVTVNKTVSAGKTTYNEATVIIDGVK